MEASLCCRVGSHTADSSVSGQLRDRQPDTAGVKHWRRAQVHGDHVDCEPITGAVSAERVIGRARLPSRSQAVNGVPLAEWPDHQTFDHIGRVSMSQTLGDSGIYCRGVRA